MTFVRLANRAFYGLIWDEYAPSSHRGSGLKQVNLEFMEENNFEW
jgi:hypothetical protein